MKKILLSLVVAGCASLLIAQAGGNDQSGQSSCPKAATCEKAAVCEKAPICDKAPVCDKDKTQCPYAKASVQPETAKSCCPQAGKKAQAASNRPWLFYAKQSQYQR